MKKLVEGDYVVPTTEEKKVEPVTKTVRVIDWLRPDHALLRGMAMSHTPQPYEERYAHQGKREMMRRVRQMRAGIIKP